MYEIPIHAGTFPSVDLQVSNAKLKGAFVNPNKEIQLLPNTALEFLIPDTRAIFQSTFQDRKIIVTFAEVFYIEGVVINKVGDIVSSQSIPQIDENNQHQVTIVNGAGAWVFDQNTGVLVQLTSIAHGFDIVNPVDVVVLETFTIIVGGSDHAWTVSEAGTALVYNANDVSTTDNTMGNLSGCDTLNNNLFIFGEGGVQRWVPGIERVPNSFPFSQDPSYRDEYGCISTGSLLSRNNEIFYLSQSGQIRRMSLEGNTTITNDGISNIIEDYIDLSNSYGSYYYHKGDYLYQLSFPDNLNAFVYCRASKKWSESSDILLGVEGSPIKEDGVYSFSSDYEDSYHEVEIQSPYIVPKGNNLTTRIILSSVILKMTQGKGITKEDQICDLQISKDNILYGNRVRAFLSAAGERLFQFRWYMNFPNNGFGIRFIFQLKQDVTIQNAWFKLS